MLDFYARLGYDLILLAAMTCCAYAAQRAALRRRLFVVAFAWSLFALFAMQLMLLLSPIRA